MISDFLVQFLGENNMLSIRIHELYNMSLVS